MGVRKRNRAGGKALADPPAVAYTEAKVPGWWPAYLVERANYRTQAEAAAIVGQSRQAVAQLVARHPELAEQDALAGEIRRNNLRRLLLEVATQGVKLPVYAPDGKTVMAYESKWDARVLLGLAQVELPEWRDALRPPDAKPDPTAGKETITVEAAEALVRATIGAVPRRPTPRPADPPAPRAIPA